MYNRIFIGFFLCMLSFPLFAQYSFDFACIDDTILVGIDVIEFHFLLENTGALSDSYAFDCRVIDSVPGWFEQFCVGGVCAEPGTILYNHLNAGEVDSAITIQVYPTLGYATEVLNLHVQSIGSPSLQDSINVYAVGVDGIEEDEQNNLNSAIVEIYPNPFSNLTNIRFGIGHSAGSMELKIYNATGRLIKAFTRSGPDALHPTLISWDGRNNAGKKASNGVYYIQIEQNDSIRNAKIIRIE